MPGVVIDPFAVDPLAAPYTESPVADFGAGGPNQIHVPVANRDWTWEQIVDAVDDYFRVERERQVQLVGDVLTEGRIDTFPLIGATIIEPHRRDSVGRYNRWESTFQTIRRRAIVRVIPDASGYLIDVAVEKDIEDLPHPECATAGAATKVSSNDDAILLHLAFQEHHGLVDERRQLDRGKVGMAIAGHAQHRVGDAFSALRGCQNPVKGFVAGRRVLMADPDLGVVQDCHEHIVELMSRRAYELAQRG
jgi:hypothetical protein